MIEKMIEKFKSESPLQWYRYDQNTSGGYYDRDDDVDKNIFVQARNNDEADRRAEEITAESADSFCECCGCRWYTSSYDIDEIPAIGGNVISVDEHEIFKGSIFYTDDGKRFRYDSHGKWEEYVSKGWSGEWKDVE